MFQYSTETIINGNVGNLPINGGVRYAAVKMSDKGMVAGEDAFIVDGVGLYHADKIEKAYRRPYQEAKNEQIKITMPSTMNGTYRLAIWVSQEGLSSSIYADAQLRHKKPFFYEITNPTVQKFADAIKAEMQMTDFNFFKASVDGGLVLTADDCYARFQKVQLVKVHEGNQVNFTGWEDYETPAEVDWVRKDAKEADKEVNGVTVIKFGTEGAGTVARLIKNLRIPTDANTNPFGTDMGGKPVPGGMYDQVTIEYVTERRHIGGQVMGALDNSITTHTFFVPKDSDFVAELKKVLTSVNKEILPVEGPTYTESAKTVKPEVGSKQ